MLSEPWPVVRALCPQSNWVVCPRWLNGVPLASRMLGSSGYNTENLTANHSGAPCWEKYHVPRTLKNPSVDFEKEKASCRYRRLNCPILPTLTFSSGNLKSLTLLALCPIPFSFQHYFMFILSPISCSSPEHS